MTVAEIFAEMARNAGQAQQQRGALIGNTINAVSQVPGQILADRERQRQLDAQTAILNENQQFKRDDRAHQAAQDATQEAQRQMDEQAKQERGQILSSGVDPNNPTQFQFEPAINKAIELKRQDVAKELQDAYAQHQKEIAPKTREIETVGPNGPERRIVPDVPTGEGQGFRVPPKDVTYGAPITVSIGGNPALVRAGSDNKLYDMRGNMVDGGAVSPLPDKEKDPPANNYTPPVPEVDPTTGKQTGRFVGYNTKTNAWEPITGQGPGATKADPGVAAAATKDVARKDAIDTLGQLDQAIELAKDKIGPGAGRVSSLEQIIGNADPTVQALGTKLLLAKMKVDAGIGGARAAASPALLARWDNLLAQKVTPEGLHSAVQAMREVLGGMNTSTSGVKVLSITPIK